MYVDEWFLGKIINYEDLKINNLDNYLCIKYVPITRVNVKRFFSYVEK